MLTEVDHLAHCTWVQLKWNCIPGLLTHWQNKQNHATNSQNYHWVPSPFFKQWIAKIPKEKEKVDGCNSRGWGDWEKGAWKDLLSWISWLQESRCSLVSWGAHFKCVSCACNASAHIFFVIIFLRISKISSESNEISPFPDCVRVWELVGWTKEPSSALTSVNIIRHFLSETKFSETYTEILKKFETKMSHSGVRVSELVGWWLGGQWSHHQSSLPSTSSTTFHSLTPWKAHGVSDEATL